MRVTEFKLCEHFWLSAILALVAIVGYVFLLYGNGKDQSCIQKPCTGSGGPAPRQVSRPAMPSSLNPFSTGHIVVWTWEVRTSTDQRDASWIPPLAD